MLAATTCSLHQPLIWRRRGGWTRHNDGERVWRWEEDGWQRPIDCRIYKACLMTQGFSRVPFVDYRVHHPPPLSLGLWHFHSVVTPLNPSHPLSCDDDTYSANDNFTYGYQHLIRTRSTIFTTVFLPDISFVVRVLLQFCSVPLPRQYTIARQILRYLKGTNYFRMHLTHLYVWGTRCFAMVMSYLPGKRGYRNIPYNSIHSALPSRLDAEDFPLCSLSPSTIAVPAAPPRPRSLSIYVVNS